jgi:ABC-type branched-subunit amino acid transport system substrate-binding protein
VCSAGRGKGKRKRMSRHRLVGATLAAAVALPLAVVAATATPTAATPAPITIAYITSITGPGAAEDASSPAAFTARIDLQNAQGGVHGHKLVPLIIDDQTNPTGIATVVQEADSKAFGVVSQSPLFFLASKYPQQAGVPVTTTDPNGESSPTRTCSRPTMAASTPSTR